MNAIRALLAAALFALAMPVAAQPYVWVSIGSAKLDALTSPDVSGSDRAAQFGVGWRFSRFVAVEASYLNLPSYDALTPTINVWSADGYTLAAVGTVPLGASLSLVGKLGVWNAESELTTVTPGGSVTETKTDLGSRPLIGAGVEFHVDQHFSARAIYEQVRGKDGTEFDKLRMFSIGALLRF
jgi:hypothetical protein